MTDGTDARGNDDRGAWFAAKRFGYGAGMPIAWQGWALAAAYIAILAGATMFAQSWSLGIIALATIVFALIARRHTRGGWRWRR